MDFRSMRVQAYLLYCDRRLPCPVLVWGVYNAQADLTASINIWMEEPRREIAAAEGIRLLKPQN